MEFWLEEIWHQPKVKKEEHSDCFSDPTYYLSDLDILG